MLTKLRKYCLILIVMISLAQLDLTGQMSYDQLRGGGQDDELVELSIYPNPASEYFTLNTNQIVKRISINTIVGKEVKVIFTNDENRYDLSDLRKGIYVVRIFGNDDSLIKALRLSKT